MCRFSKAISFHCGISSLIRPMADATGAGSSGADNEKETMPLTPAGAKGNDNDGAGNEGTAGGGREKHNGVGEKVEDIFVFNEDGSIPDGWILKKGVPTPPALQEGTRSIPWWRWILHIIFAPLSALRFIVFVLFVFVLAFLCLPVAILFPPDEKKGLSRWHPLYFLAKPVIRLICAAGGYWWISRKYVGVQKPKDAGLEREPVTLVSTHVMPVIDAFLLVMYYNGRFVVRAKEKNSFFGLALRAAGSVFVERGGSKKGSQTQTLVDVAKTKDGNPSMCIFPEGFMANGGTIQPFRKGAFVSGEPVRMVVLQYPFKWTNPAWVEPMFVTHVVRTCSSFWTSAVVVDCGLYVPSEEEKADPALYSRNVRAKMCELSGMGTSEVTQAQKTLWLTKQGYGGYRV